MLARIWRGSTRPPDEHRQAQHMLYDGEQSQLGADRQVPADDLVARAGAKPDDPRIEDGADDDGEGG